ncbi:MAG TPA: Bax inhibitor-1/YccA family protein [Bacteroidia bacterium]|nr:Bax inhibitor-1/YccA family protein [Bacteroidia bacterium]
MENFRQTNIDQLVQDTNVPAAASRTFMTNVFSWMTLALVISGITAYAFAVMPELSQLSYKYYEGQIIGYTAFGWGAMIAPFLLVLAMGIGFNRFSFPVLGGMFLLFSFLQGAFLSVIFFRYSIETIGMTFAISAGMFGTMAVMGYITKADLTRFGAILTMALFGILIAMLVNFFAKSETMSYVISLAGVLIFTGLTAYDVQKLKMIGEGTTYGQQNAMKLSVMGALTLYLDFINIFLFLLRLMGNRR